jgi:hypothetical protein
MCETGLMCVQSASGRAGRKGGRVERSASDEVVRLRPVPGGWRVTCRFGESLFFLSLIEAELQARRLAECLSQAGLDVRVELHDARDALVRILRIFAIDGRRGAAGGS